MGMLEDVTRVEVLKEMVNQLTHQVMCIHNRVEEVGDSSVIANERVSELEQKLRAEITSLRDQLQQWSDERNRQAQHRLDEFLRVRDRVSKIEERLVPSCVKATVTHCDTEGAKQRQNEELRNQPSPAIGTWDWAVGQMYIGNTVEVGNVACRFRGGIHQKSIDSGEFYYMSQIDLADAGRRIGWRVKADTRSPTPGTWAWACDQMLAGKTVSRIGKGTGIKWHMKLNGCSVDCRATDDCMWQRGMVDKADLTATDWQVVS